LILSHRITGNGKYAIRLGRIAQSRIEAGHGIGAWHFLDSIPAEQAGEPARESLSAELRFSLSRDIMPESFPWETEF